MQMLPSDADVQTHKFLHDARLMLGTIDNLLLDKTDLDQGSPAMPDLGSVREMARTLQAKLSQLTDA